MKAAAVPAWIEDVPIYRQLMELLVARILDEVYLEDEMLPSVRQLAQDCDVNPLTVAKAYKELTTKLSAGELRAVRPPAADAPPEQVAAWRTAHGLPEHAEAYVNGLALGDGMLAGEANRPMLLRIASALLVHTKGLGCSLWTAINSEIAASNSRTL